MEDWLPAATDRRATWRSVAAGFVLVAGVFGILVTVSYPLATAALLASGVGLYALGWALRRASYDRTLVFCRGGFCFRFQVSVG